MTAAEPSKEKKRTGVAILLCFASYIILQVAYGFGFDFFARLAISYDPALSGGLLAYVTIVLAPIFLASLCAVTATLHVFSHANKDAVFYSFCSVAIVIYAFASLLSFARGNWGELGFTLLAGLALLSGAKIGSLISK